MIKGCSHPAEAAALINYLLSAEVEKKLAAGPSAQIPLGEGVATDARVKGPPEIRPFAVDFEAAARGFATSQELAEKRLLNPAAAR